MRSATPRPEFWAGKQVFLTGHTGFKGAWAALWLADMGAIVQGYARAPTVDPVLGPALWSLLASRPKVAASRIADLGDPVALRSTLSDAKPEIILHMAAQALVRRGIVDPVETWRSNVMGTLNLLEAARRSPSVRTVLVVTSDKVYANANDGMAHAEEARLGGHDPYSASKAACELLVASHRASYFTPRGLRLATVRGGNVIGGGDLSEDRLVPDIVRAARSGSDLVLRHPEATRPWQHVLDCLAGYLCYAEALHEGRDVPDALNIGPDPAQSMTVGALADTIMRALGGAGKIVHQPVPGSLEMTQLAIDSTCARATLGWRDALTMSEAADWTAAWYRAAAEGRRIKPFMRDQIARFRGLNP